MSDTGKQYLCDRGQHYNHMFGWSMENAPQILCVCAADELRELRSVLSALGAVKGPDGWTVPNPHNDNRNLYGFCYTCGLNVDRCPERIPVPLAAQKEGGAG